MNTERILEIIENNDKYYVLGFIQGIIENKEILKQENEELKKQLEETKQDYQEELDENCKLSELWCDSRAKIRELETQQQEFLTYLEKEIVDCKAGSGQQYYAQEHLKMFKEIVGVKDGQ